MATNKAAVPAPMDDYAVRDDLHTMLKAHQIRNDPKRMTAVKAHHAAQKAALQKMKEVGQPLDQETKGETPAQEKAEMKKGMK